VDIMTTVIAPECDVPAEAPVLYLESRISDGSTRSDSYRPSNVPEYLAAVDRYCHLDPQVDLGGSRQDVDGSFTVTLSILNPTRKSIEVASEAFRDGRTTWDPVSVSVPPQGSAELVLHGHGQGCSHVNPWTTGHVTVDGVAIHMDESQSEQC